MLALLFMKLPEDYDINLNSARLQDLCQDALIFLDDPDEELQTAVSGELPTMSSIKNGRLNRGGKGDCASELQTDTM